MVAVAVAVAVVDMLVLGVQADAESPHPQRVYPAVVAEVVAVLVLKRSLQGLTAVELVFLGWEYLGQQVLTVIRLPPVVMDRGETTGMAVAVLVGQGESLQKMAGVALSGLSGPVIYGISLQQEQQMNKGTKCIHTYN
jgi:hypothetical protein